MNSITAAIYAARTDGNFRLPRPALPLAFTGERMTSCVDGQIEFEHYHRYCLARDLCEGRDVLDVASGEGYGSALLADVARSVVGVEIDANAVAHAQANYTRDNLRFLQGDALAIPLPDASVDVAVSFETLEHVAEHRRFLSEVRRVLRPGGLFIVSTPDRTVYSAHGVDPNPYHVLELTEPELRTLIRAHFGKVRILAQRAVLGSVLAAPGARAWRSYERRGSDMIEATNGLARAQYLVAVATDGELPDLASSAYLDGRVVHDVVQKAQYLPLVQAHEAELLRQLHTVRDELATMERRWRAAEQDALDRQAAAEAAQQRALAAEAATTELRQELLRQLADAERAGDMLRGQLADAERDRLAALEEAERRRLSGLEEAERRRLSGLEKAERRRVAELEEAERRRVAALDDAESRRLAAVEEARLARDAALAEAGQKQQTLDGILASISWQLTGPLRGLAQRHPWLAHRTIGLVHRHPNARRQGLWLLRSVWRVLTVRRPPPRPAWLGRPNRRPAETIARAQPRQWFFVGDTLDWLASHPHLTGVGHVTTALLAAAWADGAGLEWYPAVAAPGGVGLAGYRGAKPSASPAAAGFQTILGKIPPIGADPQPGDHVLFTGVVWSPTYVALFARLRDNNVRFSVLVYDIIPIQNAEFTTPEQRACFIAWLHAVVRDAETIFVSCEPVRASLAAWCAAEAVSPRRPIAVVAFGGRAPSTALTAPPRTPRAPFVLSVGTIDARKNQALLCRIWVRLAGDLGAARLPQLVLVGRDDVGILQSNAGLQVLAQEGLIRVRSDVPDRELDALYRAALFTAFASLAEGHGLPVADSLAYGKLPVVSDLPAIRAHAGDLPWYFDPADEQQAYRTLRRAIEDGAERAATERRIARAWQPPSWQSTAQAMHAALAKPAAEPALPAPLLDMPLARLRLIAAPWCGASAPDVSILIVNWNAAAMTQACVRHVWANTTGVTYEILIADNGSAPDDLAKLHALADLMPGLIVVPLSANRYFGEASNILAERANGRLLCLLNNDVFVSPGWLQGMRAALDANPRAGAVGPVFLFPDDRIQEAGAAVDALGFPHRHARGQPLEATAALCPRKVDYVSAATLLLTRALYMEAGGFDLAYEPAYYEDADLCFKIAALGHEVWLCPDVAVTHVEGFSTGEAVMPGARKKVLGDVNRAKFVSRWGDFLRTRDPAELRAATANFIAPAAAWPVPPTVFARRRALVFTPYMLTPGGGERYLLTLAMALSRDHDVTVVTPHPYSRLRLRNLGCEFGLDLSACTTDIVAELSELPEFDVMVAMGNMIVPPIAARARSNIFLCQFPFPLPPEERLRSDILSGYDQIVVYSDYARHHVLDALARDGLPDLPVAVVHPPVPHMHGDARRKKPIILTVGRFFAGGHTKRHDLLIEAFRALLARHGEAVEFHIAGSSMTRPEDVDYLEQLRAMAQDLPVVLHINCTASKLSSLYRDAAIYWHGTGLAADLVRHPEHAEHFGISIVEAMSAECVAFAFDAGGPREIITDGVDGFLYGSTGELVARTLDALSPADADRRIRIAKAAGQRAMAFAEHRFNDRMRDACRIDTQVEADWAAD
jgi:glycosyltransferase involved in cell wall biosynthesis/GT2 family glycosyltransferase/ubiquinone/menaquinone biosynthesis C-methylase UbiE